MSGFLVSGETIVETVEEAKISIYLKRPCSVMKRPVSMMKKPSSMTKRHGRKDNWWMGSWRFNSECRANEVPNSGMLMRC